MSKLRGKAAKTWQLAKVREETWISNLVSSLLGLSVNCDRSSVRHLEVGLNQVWGS